MPNAPAVAGMPRVLLRLEGAALLVFAILLYAQSHASWWPFLVLFLAPDLSFAAYFAGPRIGAAAYNALHTTLGPALLALAGFLLGPPFAITLALIWAAHIGFDRALGYGLKYGTSFADTHLGQLGRGSSQP